MSSSKYPFTEDIGYQSFLFTGLEDIKILSLVRVGKNKTKQKKCSHVKTQAYNSTCGLQANCFEKKMFNICRNCSVAMQCRSPSLEQLLGEAICHAICPSLYMPPVYCFWVTALGEMVRWDYMVPYFICWKALESQIYSIFLIFDYCFIKCMCYRLNIISV